MVSGGIERQIATITFDRPEKLNAMNRAFWSDFGEILGWIESFDTVRAIVITGAGERAFSVGGDIASFAELQTDEQRRAFQIEAMGTFESVERTAIPTIAAVRGFALGGGCEMALACDMVVASHNAKFGMPEARFGLVPGYGIMRAPNVIGRKMTKLMVLGGEQIDVNMASRCGLVQHVCAPEEVLSEAVRLAGKIAQAPPEAVRIGTELIDRAADRESFERSIEAVSFLHSTEDARAAVAAFLAE